MIKNRILLGCIADDFTGAGDIASFLEKGGLHTILISGIPKSEDIPDDARAVVISLKSRMAPVPEAVRDTLECMRYLEEYGCEKYYIKYCSTFDSTPYGNIGPVLDAVLEYMNETYTLLCPSLPVNGRTVKDGILYVNNIPLSESGMRNHPLTPMWDSRISVLMERQSRYPCVVLGRRYYDCTKKEVLAYIKRQVNKHAHYYVIPDYEKEEDAVRIIQLFSHLKVMTGGSGLAASYADYLSAKDGCRNMHYVDSGAEGAALIVAGSVSAATLGQISCYKEHGFCIIKYVRQICG